MIKNPKFKVLIFLVFFIVVGFFSLNHFKTKRDRADLTVVGNISLADGLGKQSYEVIDCLKDDLNIDFVTLCKHEKISKHIAKIVKKKQFKKWGKVILYEQILWSPGHEFFRKILDSSPDSIRIAYTMFETTKVLDEWIYILNEYFDVVLVPSDFLIDVYKNSGLTIPIFKLPLGRDLNDWLKEPLKEKCGYPFTFGNLSASIDRKNQIGLIRAFAKAFGNNPDVRLRINCRYDYNNNIISLQKEIEKLNLNNVMLTQFCLSSEEYLREFKKIDCYVSPSKGEGFSNQPREAMILGIPVIATNNTGQIEICKTGLVKSIETPILEPALLPWGTHCGLNYNFEVDDLAEALKDVKTNYDYYLGKRQLARQWASQFNYINLKDLYLSILSPKKILFSQKNRITPTCVFTNSKELIRKYKNLFGKNITRKTTEDAFTQAYEDAFWGRNENGEGFSGTGSLLETVLPYKNFLEKFLKEKKIQSVLDIGCGDWTFSQFVDWNGSNYTGIDVVKKIIKKNIEQFSTNRISFVHGNAINMNLPKADLLICKEVLQHLTNKQVQKILKKVSNYKYCLFVNDVDPQTETSHNPEISAGEYRFLDLTKPPFNLNAKRVFTYESHDSYGNLKQVLCVEN